MQRELIDRLAAYVAKAGGAFEQVSPSPSPSPSPNPSPSPSPIPNPNPNPDPGLATPSHSRTTHFPFPLTTDPPPGEPFAHLDRGCATAPAPGVPSMWNPSKWPAAA